jgi:large-conductance mechanosensitive channel
MKEVEKTREEIRKYQLAIIKQMLQLATAGFGLVAALAWNQLIQTFIEEYIKPRVGIGSGIISLAIYAFIITALAVFVTLQLSKLAEKLEEKKE